MIDKRLRPASLLRERIALQEEIRTPDGAGGYQITWQTVTYLWAQIESLRGAENKKFAALQGAVTHRVRLRRRDDIRDDMRISWAGRIANIRAVLYPLGQDRHVELLVEEGVAI